MDLRGKGNGYDGRVQAYPDVNEFQYLNRSPQASIRSPQKGEITASTALHTSYSGADVWEEPLNTPQPHFTPPPPRRSCFSVLGSWVWELLSCLLALGALAGILVILKQFNGKALREWPYSITINTLLSVLVTIIKAAIVVPLAEGISQLKWSWYKKRDHALGDLVLYDVASRGAFGASKFVLSKNPLQLATIASILLLASFAIGPFAQQVVRFDQRDILSRYIASVPVCSGKKYDDFEGVEAPGIWDVGLGTLGAIYDGYFQNNSNTPVDTICQTGNCTFNAYQSLGFCSRCADISDEIVSYDPTSGKETTYENCPEAGGCIHDFRNGKLRAGPSGASRTLINTTSVSALLHQDLADISAVFNLTALYGERNRGGLETAKAKAYECALYFCVLKYEGGVRAGNFTEVPIEVPSKTTFQQLWGIGNVTITPDTCITDGITKSPPYNDQDNCTYIVDGISGRALYRTIMPLFNGTGMKTGGRSSWFPPSVRKLWDPTENKIEAVDDVFKSLAKRLTTHARNVPDICRRTVSGKVFASEVYISVTWLWIVYPSAVVVATFLLLVGIIIRTRDEYIWKSSPLALVFLGMQDHRQSDGVTHPIFPVNPEIKSMETSSWGIKMRLDRSGRWNIVGNR